MEFKKINLRNLSDILSEKEMKSITGGNVSSSGGGCSSSSCSGACTIKAQGQTFKGTCKEKYYSEWDRHMCTCVEN